MRLVFSLLDEGRRKGLDFKKIQGNLGAFLRDAYAVVFFLTKQKKEPKVTWDMFSRHVLSLNEKDAEPISGLVEYRDSLIDKFSEPSWQNYLADEYNKVRDQKEVSGRVFTRSTRRRPTSNAPEDDEEEDHEGPRTDVDDDTGSDDHDEDTGSDDYDQEAEDTISETSSEEEGLPPIEDFSLLLQSVHPSSTETLAEQWAKHVEATKTFLATLLVGNPQDHSIFSDQALTERGPLFHRGLCPPTCV